MAPALQIECERLDRNVVDAKKLKAPSVESHSMPGGHMAGRGGRTLSMGSLYFSLSQIWHSYILNCKNHPLYNTPNIIDAYISLLDCESIFILFFEC